MVSFVFSWGGGGQTAQMPAHQATRRQLKLSFTPQKTKEEWGEREESAIYRDGRKKGGEERKKGAEGPPEHA